MGVQKGYEIGLEVGYYSGCIHMWRQLQERDANTIPPKALRGIAALEELLASMRFDDPQVGDPVSEAEPPCL